MSDSTASRRVLITGATGFVGSHLSRWMARNGWEVHAIFRPESNLSKVLGILPAERIHAHDGSTSRMLGIMARVKPDLVIHTASLFKAQHRADDITPLILSNIQLGTQLLEAMAAHDIHLLINTGTAWQHDDGKPYSPVNLYAATKQAFEDILRYYTEALPIRAVTLKLFDTYGPRDERGKLLAALQRIAEDGTSLAMSPGEQMIDLVHIDDVIQAYGMAADRLIKGESGTYEEYALSSRSPLTLRDLVRLIEQTVGRPLNIEWGKLPYRPREVMVPWSTGPSLPGWQPQVGLKAGIRNLFQGGEGSR